MPIESYLDRFPRIDPTAFVHASAVVNGKVSIGAHSSIWPMVTIRGDVNEIRIGQSTNIQDGSVLHVTADSKYDPGGFPLIIGDHITVGHKVILHGCTIEDYCLIGMGSIIMDNVTIRTKALIGAGSLVPPGKTLVGGGLWLGSPVKRIRSLTAQELKILEYSANHYVELKNTYLTSQS